MHGQLQWPYLDCLYATPGGRGRLPVAVELPRCPGFGALARPNLLMFDDWRWNPDRSQAQRDRLDRWLDRSQAPLVIEIGAGRAVATVRHFRLQRMQQRGSRLIRINRDEANIHNPDALEMALGAKEALQRIDAHIKRRTAVIGELSTMGPVLCGLRRRATSAAPSGALSGCAASSGAGCGLPVRIEAEMRCDESQPRTGYLTPRTTTRTSSVGKH